MSLFLVRERRLTTHSLGVTSYGAQRDLLLEAETGTQVQKALSTIEALEVSPCECLSFEYIGESSAYGPAIRLADFLLEIVLLPSQY